MTEFFMERLDPDHPLNRAARALDSEADSGTWDAEGDAAAGATRMIDSVGFGIPYQQLAYFAHQRAIRNDAAKAFSQRLNLTDDQQVELLRILMIANIDALSIGWRAAQQPQLIHVNRPNA